MYYVLYGMHAIGPFDTRDAAYAWVAKQGLEMNTYAVKTAQAFQENYSHKQVLPPD